MLESCDNRARSEKSNGHMFRRHAEWPQATTWTPPLVAWRLGQEMQQLDEASPEEQRQFQVALRQALAPLDRGAEER
jgi:hypothetical protein